MLAPNDSGKIIQPDSLGDTLNTLSSVLFYDIQISQVEKEEAGLWIASRQGLPRSHVGMFAPTAYDYTFGALTFTGEPVTSDASTSHVLSEEACRVLFRLGILHIPEVSLALHRSRQAILRRLDVTWGDEAWSGIYCCELCSVSMWRHFAASGIADDEQRIECGLLSLKRRRDGRGSWKHFPFFYTLLALSEIQLPAAGIELEYALPAIERALRRIEKTDPDEEKEHERRRRILMGRILQNL